jgi:hypothetical protein
MTCTTGDPASPVGPHPSVVGCGENVITVGVAGCWSRCGLRATLRQGAPPVCWLITRPPVTGWFKLRMHLLIFSRVYQTVLVPAPNQETCPDS